MFFVLDICTVSIFPAYQVALREKRGQIERELRDFKQNYGPDKVNELTQQMEESIAELDQLKDQLRKSKMANRQQVKKQKSEFREQFFESVQIFRGRTCISTDLPV